MKNAKENTIPKEIFDAIVLPKNEIILKSHSANYIFPKNAILSANEDLENEDIKDSDLNKEYNIGNYMVKYTLGQGTFGKVKLGVYLPNNEKVAIKILEKNRIIEKDDEIRVKREFDMLAQFNHPNVILVAEIFESEDSYYSVMEFCEGGELFNYIVKKTRLCEEEAAFFFYQLINGLEYIHSLGIVHRDLKPENLLLTNEHILKIIDFGLSNYFKENQEPLLSTPCGSPCYASPEMVAGKKYDGFKIDVWSCGIILYAMLCGYLPFEDPDNEILFKKILECHLEFPKYVKKLSIDLIEKILVTDPEKRITIPEIKNHPFFLKGKDIFEHEFSTTLIVRNPKEMNNINDNGKEIEEIENINNMNENIVENKNEIEYDKNIKEQENKKEKILSKLIDTELEDKENVNIENIKKKDKKKDVENNKKAKEVGNLEKNDLKKEEEKEEKLEKLVKDVRDKNENKEKLEKKEKKEKKEKIERKEKNEKIENKEKKEAMDKKEKEKEEIKELKKKLISDIKKISDKNESIKEKENKKNIRIKNKNKKILILEQEEIYVPLKTEYIESNYRFRTNENFKDNKEEKQKNTISKKSSNYFKDNNIEFDTKIISKNLKIKNKAIMKEKRKEKEENKEIYNNKIKDNSKEKEKSREKIIRDKMKEGRGKEKLNEKTIDKDKEEKINEQNKKNTLSSTYKINTNQENKKTITPKRQFYNFKTIKTQRPENLTNITKNINIKGKTQKNLEQKNSKLISAKEPVKMKSTFRNVNLNQNTNNPFLNIKGLLNATQNYKKISLDKKDKKENKENKTFYLNTEMNKNRLDMKDLKIYKEVKSISKNKKKELLEEKWKRLNTEIIQNKNKNYLENKKHLNYINNTIETIKNNIGFISNVKKTVLGNRNHRKRNDIKLYLNNPKDRKKNSDIKRMRSTTFSNNNTMNSTYNNSSIKKDFFQKNPISRKFLNRLQLLTNKANRELIYGVNNYINSNRKSPYESEIYDNIVKTEPSSELFSKLNNRDKNFNHIKTNTNIGNNINSNTILSNKLHRGIDSKNINYNNPASYFRYLNSIRKNSNNTLIRNRNNLNNNIQNNDLIKSTNLNRDRKSLIQKNTESSTLGKKNPIFTIRNTVINFNMIDTGLILPQYNKKTIDRKKINLVGQFNAQKQIRPNDTNLRILSGLYTQKTLNNSIKKMPNLYNSTFKPIFNKRTITSNHCNNHSLTIHNISNNNNKDLLYSANRRLKTQILAPVNKINAISSFNKLVTKMKNRQLYNRRHSNSVEKNHNLFKTFKLNELYLKNLRDKNERKTLDINSGLSKEINNTTINNKFRSINTNKNLTLPSLFNKKKSFKSKQKRFIMQPPGKGLRFITILPSNSINNENSKKYNIKGVNLRI